jgi:hypothetical protein
LHFLRASFEFVGFRGNFLLKILVLDFAVINFRPQIKEQADASIFTIQFDFGGSFEGQEDEQESEI